MTVLPGLYNAVKTPDSVSRYIAGLTIVVVCILMIPLVAMQYTDEVKWSFFDFVFMGALLFGAGLTYKLVARKMGIVAYRVAVGIAVVTSLVLVWINAAVGIIGDGPINILYLGVPAVGLLGAFISNFQPQGMARTLFVMALAQFLVPVIALIIGTSDFAPDVVQVFILNAVFVILYLGSAVLFGTVALQSEQSSTEDDSK